MACVNADSGEAVGTHHDRAFRRGRLGRALIDCPSQRGLHADDKWSLQFGLFSTVWTVKTNTQHGVALAVWRAF
jgi:hypothetical protein